MKTSHLAIGLRFDKRDAPRLHALADRVRQGEIPGDVATFEQAALAAGMDEPLVVHCTSAQQAHVMAALYVRLGVRQPVVHELSTRG